MEKYFVKITEFKQGELVFVRDFGEWYYRYYSHYENGKHFCFFHQQREGNTNTWKEIKKTN